MTNTITTTLTEDDIVAANMVHVRPTSKRALVHSTIAGIGLVVVATRPVFEIHLIGIVMMTYGLASLLNFFVIWPIRMPGIARRLSRQVKSLHEPTEISWDKDNISFKAESWSVTHTWSDFSKRREGDGHCLLYLNGYNNFRTIPKRSLVDAAGTDLVRLIKSEIKPG